MLSAVSYRGVVASESSGKTTNWHPTSGNTRWARDVAVTGKSQVVNFESCDPEFVALGRHGHWCCQWDFKFTLVVHQRAEPDSDAPTI